MDNKKEALKELLKVIVEEPEIVERITITIKPSKLLQSIEKTEE